MLSQLPVPIPLTTSKGKAWAVGIIDYGPQWDLLWVTFLHETGECWTFHNRDIRQEENFTFGIRNHPVAPPARPAATPGSIGSNGTHHEPAFRPPEPPSPSNERSFV